MNDLPGASFEIREEERRAEQERRSPRPHGDIMTEDDLVLWEEQKQKTERNRSMQIISGKIQKAQKNLIYGNEGIGKSTLASLFPNPIFVDTEGGTNFMNVQRFACTSWQDILDAVKYLKTEKHEFKTIVLDTADWAERFCVQYVCANAGKSSLSGFDHGKGYLALDDEFGRFLMSLNALIEAGIHVIFVAHAVIREIELPDEGGSFDKYELKCSKRISPLLKEWSDNMFFVNYKIVVTENEKGKSKAVGGHKRFIYTRHMAAYDAKNRLDLPDQIPFELPFDFGVFAKVLGENPGKPVVEKADPPPARPQFEQAKKDGLITPATPAIPAGIIHKPISPELTAGPASAQPTKIEDVPPKLLELMKADEIFAAELKGYCESKNFIPKGGKLTDIKDVVLKQMIAPTNWQKVVAAVDVVRDLQKG